MMFEWCLIMSEISKFSEINNSYISKTVCNSLLFLKNEIL